jgi:hypothetical protein
LYVAGFAGRCSRCAARAIADRRTALGGAVPKGAGGSFAPLGCVIVEARKGERIIAIISAPIGPAVVGA